MPRPALFPHRHEAVRSMMGYRLVAALMLILSAPLLGLLALGF